MKLVKKTDMLNVALYIVLFYLTISTNFIGELYNPELVDLLHNNYYVKHLLGYTTLLTFIIFSNTSGDLLYDLKLSFITYILFVMSTKNNPHYFLLCLICIFTAFMLNKINELYITNKKTKNKIESIYNYLLLIGIILIVYGFSKEYKKKKKTYGENFSFNKFIFRKI